MIIKRLLRFALGPSFLEADDSSDEVRQASEANKLSKERIIEAETKVLESLGLGSTNRSARKKNNREWNHENELVLDDILHSGIDESLDDRDDHYDDNGDDNLGLVIASGHLMNMLGRWPIATVRRRIQIFQIVGNGRPFWSIFYNTSLHSFTWSRLYPGLPTALLFDLLFQSGNFMCRQVTQRYIGSLNMRILANTVVTWPVFLLAAPILELSIYQMLGLVSDPFRLWPSSYYYYGERLWPLVYLLVWQKIEHRVIHAIRQIMQDLMGTGSRSESTPTSITSFYCEILSETLGELICLPFSSYMLQLLASSFTGQQMIHRWTMNQTMLLFKCCTVEWLVCWTVQQFEHYLLKWYTKDKVSSY